MKKMLPLLLVLATVVTAQNLGTIGYVHYDIGDTTSAFFGESGSRGLTAGSDLDNDGKQEVFMASYTHGGMVSAFEMTSEGMMELVWFSDTTAASATTYSSGTRMVQTGDLDGDGNGEIIFFRGRYSSDPNRGLWIYEANGSDNGYDLAYHNDLYTLSGDTISQVLVEYFEVADIDGDGTQELVFASNGPSWGANRSEDMFVVLSFDGPFDDPFTSLVEEYHVSAREASGLGGGSAINVAVCDIDGDGFKEVYCHAWNSHNNFFFEATGPDSYTLGDTTSVQISAGVGDHVSLMNAAVADLDANGQDEIYLTNYYTGDIYRIADLDGEATTFTNDEVDTLALAVGAAFGAVAGDINNDGTDEVYFGGSVGSNGDLIQWDGFSTSHWNTDTLARGFVSKMAVADINGNGLLEIVSAHQSVPDSMEVINGTDTTTVANPNHWIVRISEDLDGVDTEYRVVMPDDYKLANAYANPFNPTTTIEFSLPIAKTISLTVYNMLGQEVVRLIDNSSYTAGSYKANWNGLDANGRMVASGTYFYTLQYGNFNQSKQVTFLK